MEKKRDEKNINVVVPVEMYDAMSTYAKKQGYSLSDAVRFVLKEFIAKFNGAKK